MFIILVTLPAIKWAPFIIAITLSTANRFSYFLAHVSTVGNLQQEDV